MREQQFRASARRHRSAHGDDRRAHRDVRGRRRPDLRDVFGAGHYRGLDDSCDPGYGPHADGVDHHCGQRRPLHAQRKRDRCSRERRHGDAARRDGRQQPAHGVRSASRPLLPWQSADLLGPVVRRQRRDLSDRAQQRNRRHGDQRPWNRERLDGHPESAHRFVHLHGSGGRRPRSRHIGERAGGTSSTSPSVTTPQNVSATSPTNTTPHISWQPPVSFVVTGWQVLRDGVVVNDATIRAPAASTMHRLPARACTRTSCERRAAPILAMRQLRSPSSTTPLPPCARAADCHPESRRLRLALVGAGSRSAPGSGSPDYIVRRGSQGPRRPIRRAAPAICTAVTTATGCVDSNTASGSIYGYSVFAVDGAGNQHASDA